MGRLNPEEKKALKRVIDRYGDQYPPEPEDIDILRPLVEDEPIRHNVFDQNSMGD